MRKVNVAEKFAAFSDAYHPRLAGELNGQEVKLVRIRGGFIWHHHDTEDALFYVVKGSFDMHFRDRVETISEGEFIIVPKGTEHKPVAAAEALVMLFEPAAVRNTGNIADSTLTRHSIEKI